MSNQESSIEVEESTSVFQSSLPLETKLERARTELLDLSARNRLLNVPRSGKSAKILEVVDEQSAEIFRLLVRENRALTFLPGRQAPDGEPSEEGEELVELGQPDDEGVNERGVANRHADTKLQTRLTPAGLQKRLLDLYYDARTLEEEQGVNILFLALGTLKWVDPNNAANVRYAPLILVPVALERGNAAEKFKLRWRNEDPAANLSLEALLERVHDLKLPTFEGGDDFDPVAYMKAVEEAISAKPNWSVEPNDIVLGFFSFAKFLMYRDLDPANWPKNAKLSEHELIRSLVSDGFDADEPLLSEDSSIDAHILPSNMVHIVDSDSSQTLAVHEVRNGRNLVIQGPPGTGKSQTIANIIGTAVADGRTVLFVAEKMAALEVVKRRLDHTGVGDVCLELHSNKANKKAVLEELRRTWELGAPKAADLDTLNSRLTEARDMLNAHAHRLHEPLGAGGYTPYQVIGHLVRLKQVGQQPTEVVLDGPDEWTASDLYQRSALLSELLERIEDIGIPAKHSWRGIEVDSALPSEVDRYVQRIEVLLERLASINDEAGEVAGQLELTTPEKLRELDVSTALANRCVGAPDLPSTALGAAVWRAEANQIDALVAAGERLSTIRDRLVAVFKKSGWAADLESARAVLAPLASSTPLATFDRTGLLVDLVPNLSEEAARLSKALGREGPPRDLFGIMEMSRVGERVSAAPEADAEALLADLWDSAVDRGSDLATAVGVLEAAREEINSELSDAAWKVDLGNARRVLASHGSSFFRFFSGEWRAANRLVRSYLTNPKTPLQRQLTLLDTLGRGRAAIETIHSEDSFGRQAFGNEWRGEKSSSSPLLALVDWMRSLKGLGAEPRLVASRRPDRALLASLSARVSELGGSVRNAATQLWDDLGTARHVAFANAADASHADLEGVQEAAAQLSRAHGLYCEIAEIIAPELDVRRQALEALADGQALVVELQRGHDLGAAAFGPAWEADDSDFTFLRAAATWITTNLDIHELAAKVGDRPALLHRCVENEAKRTQFVEILEALLHDLRAGLDALIAPGSAPELTMTQLRSALETWRDDAELLSKWVAYRTRARTASSLGMEDLIDHLHSGEISPEQGQSHFEMAYFEAVFADQVAREPELAQFDGSIHNRAVQSFGDLDKQRIRQSALEVVREHHRRIPPASGGRVGPLGVLKSEIARKRGHMPIRKLMQQAGPAIQALKPVMMMSPLSVAQYLEPGGLTFDLLVMDEASQIQPVDALGAIARCKQVVVVGDPQQLPPTAFFSKMTGNTDGDDDDGTARVGDIESILGLFTARGLPMRMLRWHYRSRHESLIAVSNKQFYENKLFIVPSPYMAEAGLGLRFHHIADGIFETGTSRTNPIEAKAVARAIVAHAIAHPDQSLGVVAFSAAQRRAIQDQLEVLRRALPLEQEAFFQAHPAEPFFIKNLENVQGDERDVIFISVGYGPTAPGLKPPMRFGPLGQDGGERRLNVLISRAKKRCEIFASMTDEDIEPEFASARKGVFAFKLFMHFARTGKMSLAEATARDHDSVFEAQVQKALQERGYKVDQQVGIAGFFIDLAVADPDRTDRYLLGVECDGVAYHEARSARDRDRLRQAILEDHGWIIHRIWSTDWFRRPKAELDRLVAAVEAAKVELAASGERASRRPTSALEIVSVDREDVVEMSLVAQERTEAASTAYVEAALTRPSHLVCELHEAPTGVLSHLAEQVVAIEGPVHLDEIINRIRDAWGLKRAGGRIQDAVERAVAVSVRQKRLQEEDDWFYSVPGSDPIVRDRSAAKSASLRKPECLPPTEIRVALLDVIGRNFGATEDQAVQAVSRAFGVKATSAQLREIIVSVVQQLLKNEELTKRDALIELGPNAPVKIEQAIATSPLEQLIGLGESETLEFKQTLRWDVRGQTVNKKLEEVVVKTIAAFGNCRGGTLLIGVCDDGTIAGISEDMNSLGGTQDKMELHLTNLLNSHFPAAYRATKTRITFPSHGGALICRVDVERSRWPLYVKVGDRTGVVSERLFVRSGNSSQEIPPSQIASFVKEHFDHLS